MVKIQSGLYLVGEGNFGHGKKKQMFPIFEARQGNFIFNFIFLAHGRFKVLYIDKIKHYNDIQNQ